jgi:hypothetical protein
MASVVTKATKQIAWYTKGMKTQRILNPNVFVKDENDPAFRAHIARRAKEAADPKNRLPLSELKKHLAKRTSKIVKA